MKTIKGPIVPLTAGSIVYQITLASGMVITNPAAFGPEGGTIAPTPIVVAENGQILIKQGFQDALERVSRRTKPSQASS